jgi:hypothetical protein
MYISCIIFFKPFIFRLIFNNGYRESIIRSISRQRTKRNNASRRNYMLFTLYSKLCNAQNGIILAEWSMFFQTLHLNLYRYKLHEKVKKFVNSVINSRLHSTWANDSLCQSISWHMGRKVTRLLVHKILLILTETFQTASSNSVLWERHSQTYNMIHDCYRNLKKCFEME